MLRIDTCTNASQATTISLTGDFTGEYIPCVERAIEELTPSSTAPISLNLKHVALVDRAAMCFLAGLERRGLGVQECPGYVVRWMEQEFRECS